MGNIYNNPYYNIKTPQQIQAELQAQANQYQQMYNQAQQVCPSPNNPNGLNATYVSGYDEVVNAQVSMNGTPTLFVGNGIMWSKKFVNGQAYISAFKFEPINNVGDAPQTNNLNSQEKPENDLKTILNAISDKIDNFEKRISALEPKKEEE